MVRFIIERERFDELQSRASVFTKWGSFDGLQSRANVITIRSTIFILQNGLSHITK